MKKEKTSALDKIVSVLFAISLVILIITFSIGLPIYFRPFYYMQIDPLGIEASCGHTKAEIKDAFDELMDYLTLGREFGVGTFSYSESGKSHFYDCKVLFNLNTYALAISLLICTVILLIYKFKGKRLWQPFGLHVSFYAAAGTLIAFAVTAFLISLDFMRAFKIFHRIFFPGKSNWYFDVDTDPIILALPNKFFMRCAILIISSIILICISIIIASLVAKKRRRGQKTKDYFAYKSTSQL